MLNRLIVERIRSYSKIQGSFQRRKLKERAREPRKKILLINNKERIGETISLFNSLGAKVEHNALRMTKEDERR